MAKRTDDSENFIIEGTLTVLNSVSSGNGTGCLEVTDTVYTDKILPNTISGVPVDLYGLEFLDNTITITNTGTPSVPSSNSKEKIYLDSGFLKSINNEGKITIYQPNTTKGDILSHNGTTQTRFPVGENNTILKSNSLTTNGLEWVKPSTLPSYSYSFSWVQFLVSEITYEVFFRFLYKGTNIDKIFTNFNCVSFKTTSSVYTYDLRIFDITNNQVISQIIGLNNTNIQNNTTNIINNLPVSSAVFEFQSRLSSKIKDGVEINYIELL